VASTKLTRVVTDIVDANHDSLRIANKTRRGALNKMIETVRKFTVDQRTALVTMSTLAITTQCPYTTSTGGLFGDQIEISIDVNGVAGRQLWDLSIATAGQVLSHHFQHLSKAKGIFGGSFVLVQDTKQGRCAGPTSTASRIRQLERMDVGDVSTGLVIFTARDHSNVCLHVVWLLIFKGTLSSMLILNLVLVQAIFELAKETTHGDTCKEKMFTACYRGLLQTNGDSMGVRPMHQSKFW
jgi:hypothetical protein